MVFLQKKGQSSGNINPRHIVLTEEGKYKLIDNIITHHYKHYDQLLRDELSSRCFLSPREFKSLGHHALKPNHMMFKSEIFSLGLTILRAASLLSNQRFYDWRVFKIDEGLI